MTMRLRTLVDVPRPHRVGPGSIGPSSYPSTLFCLNLISSKDFADYDEVASGVGHL